MPIRILAFLAILFAIPRAQSERFFRPTEGFKLAKDLPEDFVATVRSVQLDVKDAFEGSTAHSDAEQTLFEVGNSLHWESNQGTIRRRLLFKEGDSITRGLLLETEKNLRQEEFLADALIEVMPWQDGSAHVKVTTYDQWTTVPGVSLQRLGGEWIYWIGPVESNLLGTGQRLGFFIGHDQIRDTKWLDYANNAFTPKRLRLTTHAALYQDRGSENFYDGYSVLFSLSKPLESRTSRWSFSSSYSADRISESVYFDANDLPLLPDSVRPAFEGSFHTRAFFSKVATHDVNLSVTRSYGHKTKFNVSPSFDWRDRYNAGEIRVGERLRPYVPIPVSAQAPNQRNDYLLGVNLAVYQYDYKTVSNFRNLKWSETLETGWRLSTKVAQNQGWMGAENNDFYLSHAAVYNNAWWSSFYFNSSASLRYFAGGEGLDDGYVSGWSEMQWKPVPLTSSYLAVTWNNFFASQKSQQLLLGEDNGLNGYPSFYYAGQARLLIEAEQRLFTTFEVGTVVPALAVFANAGNTFRDYEAFDADKLHYALGLGLRLGASKSTQKVVNHFNLSWPVGESELSGPVFSIRAKKSL